MPTIFHSATTRGTRDMGWIKLYQSFNPNTPPAPTRDRFGALVIFDNGIIAPGGQGFGMHPHRDMEIASVVVSGTMEHSDSAGHRGIALRDSVQLISAGTGVSHSEYNHSPTEPIDNLQIWFLPRRNGLPPNYQTMASAPADRHHRLQLLLAPTQEGHNLVVNQDVFLWRGTFDAATPLRYECRLPGNGVYVFVIAGQAQVAGHELGARDAVGLTGAEAGTVELTFSTPTDVLLVDVPLTSF